MKRSPLKRKAPLRRKAALPKARKPLARKGQPRFKQGRDPDYLAWIRTQPCWCVKRGLWDGERHINHHACSHDVEPAHIKSRGAGGPDRGNVLPLCRSTHGYQHNVGLKTWAANYHATVDDLKEAARELDARYRALKEEA